MLPLRQKTEFGTLREVVLERTDKAAFPPRCKANANFTDHIEDLGPDFYDKYEENQLIPIVQAKPELLEAYDKLHADLTRIDESEGVAVQRISVPSDEILNYIGFRPTGYWPFTIANFWQIFGNVLVETAFLNGIAEPLKDWDFVWLDRDETAIHGAGNVVPLGPDSSGKHRVLVLAKTPRVAEEIEERGVRAIPVEVELGARNGGGISCATLVLNRDD